MSMNNPDIPVDDPGKNEPRDKKAQNSFLALGIVFLVMGIGMSFSGSSLWVAFVVMGLAFLGVSATSRVRKGGKTTNNPPGD